MKHIRKDILGNKYGRLLVLSFSHSDEKNHLAHWKCQCDCGNIVIVSGNSLRKGNTKSCGCYKRDRTHETQYEDMVGYKFGKLTVLMDIGRTEDYKVLWDCKCDCGRNVTVTSGDLRSGKSTSCGCTASWKGNLNPRWRGGIYKDEYSKIWTKELRAFIRNLDEHQCKFPKCNYNDLDSKTKLHVHHIDGNKKNCDTKNLISLCHSHHTSIEANNPSVWIDYFYSLTGGYT